MAKRKRTEEITKDRRYPVLFRLRLEEIRTLDAEAKEWGDSRNERLRKIIRWHQGRAA